ncbi:Saccharopine dehydrogenase, partial [Ascosphaera atra]
SALTPETTLALVQAGYKINVERSPTSPLRKRIFPDAAFEAAGATLVPEGSWVNAPADHIIVGLKELDEAKDFPLKHAHVTFAHCYKNQGGWEKALGRWSRGGGVLYDLEFLQDDAGRRVAAFGYHAGFAGAALAIKNWVWQLEHPGQPLPGVNVYTDNKGYYGSEAEMINQIRGDVKRCAKIAGRKPRILVIGALGRCGRGAVDACTKLGCCDILRWDIAETAKGGPFVEIVESDIFINCIYLREKIPHFVDRESLRSPKRKLSVVCDVSCDTTNPNNPIPIYSINTTFDKPTVPVDGFTNPPLSVISIDHLPSLLPAESSNAFSKDLLPSLLAIKNRTESPVWNRAEKLFIEKIKTLPPELQKREV